MYTSNKWIICEIHLNKAVAKKKKRYTKQIWTKKLGGNLKYWQVEFTNVIIDKCTIDSKIRWKWRKRLILFVMNIYSQFKILATKSNGVFFKNMINRVYLRDARVTQHQKIYQSDRQRAFRNRSPPFLDSLLGRWHHTYKRAQHCACKEKARASRFSWIPGGLYRRSLHL